MATEIADRASADGLTERTYSRTAAVLAASIAVVAVVLALYSTDAGVVAKTLGALAALGSGVGLAAFGWLGRGSLVPPIWILTLLSALATVTVDYPITDGDDVARKVLRAGLLGFAIVVSAVAAQFAADRRFATPVGAGQVRVSMVTLVVQVVSAAVGLVSLVVAIPAGATVSYGWFGAGALGLFALAVAGAIGLRRA